ncbi:MULTISPECIES: class I SAM-dependent methyltransferase [unclassified Nocardioides]|uniref:class I SAM-dependent methyltransferase n=1 Tax=unclassified Nocardioides TaxID=2615069 RepID=UPI0009F1531A|nr:MULTISPECIES: methyltransferase domain-containing protein [unclassified Nocardioides]GAW50853.1 type 11 methyltransferase [Nocardioides sp. PD653-B2]GAW54011.1 type 11 methyltransferase [Nocardioides sp. PD653]
MAFDVAADAYARFMGRYSEPLADRLVELAGVRVGMSAVDVGCGPGVLTARLVERLGADRVAALDPSPPFVAAARERCPGVDIRQGTAEALPYDDGAFDLAFANLVVHFMSDPVGGLREMGRVGGVVAATVWNHAGGSGPLSTFWRAVQDLDPDAADEAALPGTGEGDLGGLARRAGLSDVEEGTLTVSVPYPGFDEWWEPYTRGVGPAGDYVAGLDEARREALRARCAELLPKGPFEVEATAWSVVARG